MDTVLLNYGAIGVMLIFAGYAIRLLDGRCSDIYEKRIEEGKLILDALNKNTTALLALTEAINGKKR